MYPFEDYKLLRRAGIAAVLLASLSACASSTTETEDAMMMADENDPPSDPPASPPDPQEAQIARLLGAGSENLGDRRVTLPDDSPYTAFLEQNETGVVIIEGVGIDPSDLSSGRTYYYGTVDNATGVVTVTDTQSILLDSDGFFFDPSNGNRTIALTTPDSSSGQLQSFETLDSAGEASIMEVTANGESRIAVIGVSTRPEDITSFGTAVYSGGGFIDTSIGPDSTRSFANADLTADFVSGMLDARVFSDTTDLRATGMTIDGNTFTGGTITVLSNGSDVTDTYDGSQDAAGLFFGELYDTFPGLAGGHIGVSTNSGLSLVGTYTVGRQD